MRARLFLANVLFSFLHSWVFFVVYFNMLVDALFNVISRLTASPSLSRATESCIAKHLGCLLRLCGRTWRSKSRRSAAPSSSAWKRASLMKLRFALISMNSKGWTVNQSLLVPQRKVSKRGRKATGFHAWHWKWNEEWPFWLVCVCMCSSLFPPRDFCLSHTEVTLKFDIIFNFVLCISSEKALYWSYILLADTSF